MVLGRFSRPKRRTIAAERLYRVSVERSRAPVFFTGLGVPDTIDGRFDLLTLHIFLVMEALKAQGQAGAEISVTLANLTFAGFDQALRDLGVSDFGLARRIKVMADAFYGRLEAYRAADDDRQAFASAVARNLYRSEAQSREAEVLAAYAIAVKDHVSNGNLLDGHADFGPLPELASQ